MLEFSYIGLSLLMTIILISIGFYSIKKTESNTDVVKKKKTRIVIGFILWHIYVYVLSKSGFLADFSFPPRFALLMILPLFIFTGIFIYRNMSNDWIKAIPEHWLVFYQTFRIFIETIFVYSVAAGILNYHVTIEGYNFDMVFAYSAPVLGLIVYKWKDISPNVILIWNYTGLLIIASIIFLFMSSIYNPSLFGESDILIPIEMTSYPFTLVAGFLMPSAVFVHVLSIVQINKTK